MKKLFGFILLTVVSLITNRSANAQNASFEVTYIGFSAESEAAFAYATDIWSQFLVSDVPIKIVVHLQPLLPGQLGITFPNGELNFVGAPVSDVWYASCLANALTGSDLSDEEADMEIYINSFGSWYFGLDGETPAGKYDFVSTALHEICHGLGFLSLANKNGSAGSFGLIEASAFAPLTTSFPWPDLDTLPSVFDIYLENLAGTQLTTLINPSDALGTAFSGNQVYCNSPMVVEDNFGERGRIYAPGTFTLGSSLSHWDEASYPVGNPNELMTPQAAAASSIHSPGPLTLSLLDEIGWEIIYDTATTGLESFIANDILLYPNPASTELSIITGNNSEFQFAEILNCTGAIAANFQIDKTNTSLNIIALPEGYYILKLIGEDTSIALKFIKE